MGIGVKLQNLIKERRTNVNELSLQANVSPQTLYSIIKRDNTKADINVLINICKVLGVPVEYFSDEVLDNAFSGQEIGLVKKYRRLDDDGRNMVDVMIDTRLAQLDGQAEEGERKLG